MLNKSATLGQGSNDEFRHLIQVNAPRMKLNLFTGRSRICAVCSAWKFYLNKQTRGNLCQSVCVLWPLFLGQSSDEKGLWPNSLDQRNGIFSHDLPNRSTLNLLLVSFFLFFQIYTEWANYYLERHKSKRKVIDLSVDARDGLLLAEIVEAVTSFKVPELMKKPKSQQQMVSRRNQSHNRRVVK